MPRLTWGQVGERYFETGVDRGVLYVGASAGVPWNGLTSVSEDLSGGEARPYYIDGVKYLNLAAAEEFVATIAAFSSPKEFGVCDGVSSIQNGLFVTQQPRKSFGLCYRTLIGNDVDGTDHGYKLHVVYNALAAPASRSNNTIADSSEPTALSWSVSTLAPGLSGYRPTAHLIFDSRYTPPNLLAAVEDILYGSDTDVAWQPEAQYMVDLAKSPGPIVRTNLATDPAPRLNPISGISTKLSPRWYGTGGAGTTAIITGMTGIPAGTSSMSRKTWTKAPTSNQQSGFSSATSQGGENLSVQPGKYYTASAYLRASSGGKLSSVGVSWHDSGHAIIGAEVYVFGEYFQPNVWTRLSGTRLAPDGAAYVRFMFDIATGPSDILWAPGDTLDASGLLIEEGAVLRSYFDGGSSDVGPESYAWTGEVYASTSVARSWYDPS